jgi:hypothetical protein
MKHKLIRSLAVVTFCVIAVLPARTPAASEGAGVHELGVCVEQRGTDGRLPRRACAAIALVISCS